MSDRRIAAMSRGELERRWSLAREVLRERGLDALVMVSGDALLSGYIRWFTDAPFAYRKVVAFYPDDLMTLIEHGSAGSVRQMDGDSADYPGVGELIAVAEFPSVHYSQDHEARELVGVLKRRGARSVGLLNPGGMPYEFLRQLKEKLPEVAFHNVSDPIDRIKAIKSVEEVSAIRKTAAMQDACFARLLKDVRPGMRDLEIAAIVADEGRLHGSEGGVTVAGSGAIGEPAIFQAEYKQGRVLREGDHFSVLIENSGAGGYFLEMVRPISVGKAPQRLLDAFQMANEAQADTLRLLKPGASFADIYDAHNRNLAKFGLPPDRRLFAHGQGYDMVERPLVRDDESMIVEQGMCLTVHPSYAAPDVWVTVTDNYMIESDGPGECLHRTEKRVFEI